MRAHARHDDGWERPDGGFGMEAFEAFFRNHYRGVVRLAQSVVGDSQAAQDVAQDVFLAAFRRFPGDYEQAARWVRVAAVHTALNVLRGERRRDKRQLLAESGQRDPFYAQGAPSWAYLLWVACWFLIVLIGAVASFERREL